MDPKVFGERFRKVRDELGLKQQDIAKSLGVSQSYISGIEKGNKNPSETFVELLCCKFNINKMWLLNGEGPMFLDDSYTPIPQIPLEVLEEMKRREAEGEAIDDESFCKVPIYNVKAAAGDGYLNESEAVIDYIVFRKPYIRNYFLTTPNGLFLIEVVGDSMEPTFRNGDLIMADRSKIYDRQDGIYVIKRSGELMVKRIQFLDNEFLVISDNKLYPPYKTKEIEIVGKVIWFGRKL